MVPMYLIRFHAVNNIHFTDFVVVYVAFVSLAYRIFIAQQTMTKRRQQQKNGLTIKYSVHSSFLANSNILAIFRAARSCFSLNQKRIWFRTDYDFDGVTHQRL